MVRTGAAAMLFMLGALMAACSGGDAPKTASATVTSSATSLVAPAVTSTPVPTPTATPLPTVEPPALKLRLVNVATGANSELPVGFGGFGRSRAWSPDSTRMVVANDGGLSVGLLTAQRFNLLWAGSCFGVDWSPTQDQIAAGCKDGLIVLSAGGGVIARDQAGVAEWVHWAPDGKAVAYGSRKAPMNVMKLDGTETSIAGSFVSAQWLADGRLVTVEQPNYRDAATIRIHDPARDYAVAVTAVTRAGAERLGIDREGRYAAYGVLGPAANSDLPRILPSTVTILRLADGEVMATFPTYAGYGEVDFSPDGRSILMQSDFCGPEWAVEVGGLDGSRRVIAPGSALYTKFSRDGAQVGILRGTVVHADGSAAARRIAEGLHGPAGFDWSPDGKWISVPPYFGGFGICS